MWIDSEYSKVGEIGYLVRTLNTNDGSERYSLRERPARTNLSHALRLTGWVGETNNQSVTAVGCYRVVRTNRAGDRAQVVRVDGTALADFLASDGYPEIIPEGCETSPSVKYALEGSV